MTHFSTLGLVGHLNNRPAVYSIKRLIRYLQKRQKHYVLEVGTAELIDDKSLVSGAQQIVEMDTLGQVCDLVVVVGGDGSLLRAGRALAEYEVPLLGVNRGRLGFLTDILPDDIENKVDDILKGKYIAESRFLLDMEVKREDTVITTASAMNDVVLHPGKFVHMLQFEIYVDGDFVTSQRADGVIVSTPTGSTAYSLSGGGPILHPKLDAIALVPMNPHTLSSRPMVVSGNSEIRIVVGEHSRALPLITCDGATHVEVQTGDSIVIRKKAQHLQLLHPQDYNFFERCRSKLGWGGHLLDQQTE